MREAAQTLPQPRVAAPWLEHGQARINRTALHGVEGVRVVKPLGHVAEVVERGEGACG